LNGSAFSTTKTTTLRGDVILMADRAGGDFAGKRPGVVVQSDRFALLAAVLACPLTSHAETASVLQAPVRLGADLPLSGPSGVMVDKLAAIRRDRVRPAFGRLHPSEMTALERSLALVLGFG